MAHVSMSLASLAAVAVVAALASSLQAVPAAAGTICKSKTSLGDGFTEDLAVSS